MKKMTSIWIASALMLSLESVAAAGYYKVEKVLANNGKMLNKTTIASPAKAPLGMNRPKANVLSVSKQSSDGLVKSTQSSISKTMGSVAVSTWSFGCTPTSGAMIAGYYDRHGFGNIYKDSDTDMPERNEELWPDKDGDADGMHQNPLSASRKGLDGNDKDGHVDDYWVEYGNNDTDPHEDTERYPDSIADFMKTNMHAYDNPDGSTTIFSYGDGTPLTADAMEGAVFEDDDGVEHEVYKYDGAYGLKSFMESREYNVDVLYNQVIDAKVTDSSKGFTFDDYKAEIDAGHPVMIHLTGHTVVGVGYDDSGSDDIVILYDTWDFDQHTMVWGGQYGEGSDAMDQESVSIIHISEGGSNSTILPPEADAGEDQNIVENNSITLDASGSIDSDGSIVSYLWKEGATVLSEDRSFTKSDFSPGTHIITLTVTGDDNATASDIVVVRVSEEGSTPIEDPDPADDPDTNSDDTPSGGGGGCTYDPNSRGFDLMLLLMLLASVAYPVRRKLFR